MPALDGLRILDMTQWEAGPSATQLLAWLGADVVKVEPTGAGEPGRTFAAAPGADSPYYVYWNSNKRDVAIDLRNPEGRKLLLQMLPKYDVFVENYGPGVVEKLDLTYETMKAVHPELIYARVKGFGSTGPYADYKCMDMIAQAAAGTMSVTGMPDGPPMRPGPTMGDAGTGSQLGLAIAAAYIQRMRTGKGQLIEISMQEATTYYMRTMIATGSDWGRQPTGRAGNGFGPLMNLYPCAGDGPNDYVYIMIVNQRMWENLARVIGRADLIDDPRFEYGLPMMANGGALVDEIQKWTLERDKHQAMKEICEAGVPCSAVLSTQDLFENPHLQSRGFVHELQHPQHGPIKLLGSPIQMSESVVELSVAPALGQHTTEVLGEDLGLSAEAIETLAASGIVIA